MNSAIEHANNKLTSSSLTPEKPLARALARKATIDLKVPLRSLVRPRQHDLKRDSFAGVYGLRLLYRYFEFAKARAYAVKRFFWCNCLIYFAAAFINLLNRSRRKLSLASCPAQLPQCFDSQRVAVYFNHRFIVVTYDHKDNSRRKMQKNGQPYFLLIGNIECCLALPILTINSKLALPYTWSRTSNSCLTWSIKAGHKASQKNSRSELLKYETQYSTLCFN